jgi:methyl-accepting chemotaxis protein
MAQPKHSLIAELASRIGNLGVEVADIAGHLDEVTTRATQQSTQFKQLQGAAEIMVAGNREIDRAARETQSAASTAGVEITESRALIGGAVQHIGQLAAAVGRIEERLGSFSALLKQIGDVAATIETIAKHTRLLALNAAVEAARAGEAGRGFAVVAAEVKTLAEQTSRATQEISSKIGEIQSVSMRSAEAIQRIGVVIAEVNEVSNAIAAAVHEQGAATQEISRNVQEAANGTRNVSANIGGVTEAAQNTGAASVQTLSAASELSRQSETLRRHVDTFVIDVQAA